jgi:hypothetical protein
VGPKEGEVGLLVFNPICVEALFILSLHGGEGWIFNDNKKALSFLLFKKLLGLFLDKT